MSLSSVYFCSLLIFTAVQCCVMRKSHSLCALGPVGRWLGLPSCDDQLVLQTLQCASSVHASRTFWGKSSRMELLVLKEYADVYLLSTLKMKKPVILPAK